MENFDVSRLEVDLQEVIDALGMVHVGMLDATPGGEALTQLAGVVSCAITRLDVTTDKVARLARQHVALTHKRIAA